MDCERTFSNLSAHYRKSRRHRERARTEPVECTICNEDQGRDQFVKCAQCVHTWCRTCDTAMYACPYCRYATPSQRYLRRRRERRERSLNQIQELRDLHLEMELFLAVFSLLLPVLQ